MELEAPTLQNVIDREAIRDVLHRYCRGIDRMDQTLVRSCYHPDAKDEHGSFSGGVDDYLEWCWKLLRRYDRTMHYLTNILIEVDGDRAQAESYGVALHEGDPEFQERNLSVGFRFIDVFEKRDNQWRILRRVATTEWAQKNSADSRFDISPALRRGRRDAEDALYQDWRGPINTEDSP